MKLALSDCTYRAIDWVTIVLHLMGLKLQWIFNLIHSLQLSLYWKPQCLFFSPFVMLSSSSHFFQFHQNESSPPDSFFCCCLFCAAFLQRRCLWLYRYTLPWKLLYQSNFIIILVILLYNNKISDMQMINLHKQALIGRQQEGDDCSFSFQAFTFQS